MKESFPNFADNNSRWTAGYNQRFIWGVFTKDTSEEMGQARDTSTPVTFNVLNSTNSPQILETYYTVRWTCKLTEPTNQIKTVIPMNVLSIRLRLDWKLMKLLSIPTKQFTKVFP